MNQDLIRRSVERDEIIFHEEVARDGAQGKSFLSGKERVFVAQSHAAIFGADAMNRLVFMAGFPSSSHEEFEAVREMVDQVDACYLGVAGRCSRDDVDTMLSSIKGARYGRIVVILPTSEATCQALAHRSPREMLATAVEVVRYAVDRSCGLPVDVALLDSNRAAPGFLVEVISTLLAAGASMAIVCDTVGVMLPNETRHFFADLRRQLDFRAPLVCHLHNDLGFGLANTLEALRAGVRGLTSSWLGLGERAGMPPTEQLLFNLGHRFDRLKHDLGLPDSSRMGLCDLKKVVPLAQHLSRVMQFPLRTTDPIVGSGVNTISTGTPFTNPAAFQPYDPEEVLGVPRRILLTGLASKRVVTAVASELGFKLDEAQADAALAWLKAEVYRRAMAVMPREEFAAYLERSGLTSTCETLEAQP